MNIEQKETGRVEAFSDGVFAFAITLLVLNLKDPTFDPLLGRMPLLGGLLAQWPSLFALVASFATILIMWVNHHFMFTHIKRIDATLLFLNGLLLFFIVLQPFTTLLVANHVSLNQTTDAETAAAVYSGCCVLLGLVWTTMGWYAAKRRLLSSQRGAERRYLVGLPSYLGAFGLSFLYPLASVVMILIVAGYFATFAGDFYER